MVVMVYNFLIEGNEKYGSNRDLICESTFDCSAKDINENVIIAPTWKVDIFEPYVDKINHISGPTGHGYVVNELVIGDQKITYISTGIGDSNILDATLALGCTSCKKVIFIGSVGALDESIKIGDIIIPEYSVCGVGANRYLCMDKLKDNDCFGKKYCPDPELFDLIRSVTDREILNTHIKYHIGHTFSVSTIFAQYAHLDEIINMNCNSIEMETASFFDASKVAGIKSAAIFGVSDNTISRKSLYNGRTTGDIKGKNTTKKEIIPLIALRAFGAI